MRGNLNQMQSDMAHRRTPGELEQTRCGKASIKLLTSAGLIIITVYGRAKEKGKSRIALAPHRTRDMWRRICFFASHFCIVFSFSPVFLQFEGWRLPTRCAGNKSKVTRCGEGGYCKRKNEQAQHGARCRTAGDSNVTAAQRGATLAQRQ